MISCIVILLKMLRGFSKFTTIRRSVISLRLGMLTHKMLPICITDNTSIGLWISASNNGRSHNESNLALLFVLLSNVWLVSSINFADETCLISHIEILFMSKFLDHKLNKKRNSIDKLLASLYALFSREFIMFF